METNGKSCDICSRMNSVELATSRCIDCFDDLCEKCANSHHANRLSMEHRVMSLDDSQAADFVPDTVGFCEKHADRRLEVYCFDDELACCLMCATTDHRKCKMVESLEECAEKQASEDDKRKLKEVLEEFNQECEDEKSSLLKNKEGFGAQVDDIRSRIQSMKESVVRFLNDKEAEFMEQLVSLQNEKNDKYAVKVDSLSEFQEKVGVDIKKMKNCSDKNKVALFLEMKKAEKNHRGLVRNLQSLQYDYKKINLKLEDASFLTPILLEEKPYGKIVVEETIEECKTNFLSSELVQFHVLAKSGCRLTDVEAIGDEHVLAVCDNHNKIYLFSITQGFITARSLSGKPWAMTKIDPTSVAITIRAPQPGIEIVDLRMDKSCILSSNEIIKLSFKPNGIAFDNGGFIVSSTDGLLRHIDESGSSLHTVSVTKGYVYGLCFHSRRIIYSHHVDKGKVYALFDDKLGTQEFTFEHEDLSYPLGVTCDSRGNVYVVGCSTNNVLQLNSEGTFVRRILSRDKDEAISNPMGIRVATMGSSPKFLLTCQNEIRIYDFDSH